MSGTTSTNGVDNDNKTISGVAGTEAANVDPLHEMASSLTTVNDDQATINSDQSVVNANQAAFNDNQRQRNAAQTRTNAQVRRQLRDNCKVASTGVAAAVAIASIPALDTGKKVGLGVGTYDGRSAVAMALTARVSDALQARFNLGTGSDGRMAASMGGNYAW